MTCFSSIHPGSDEGDADELITKRSEPEPSAAAVQVTSKYKRSQTLGQLCLTALDEEQTGLIVWWR